MKGKEGKRRDLGETHLDVCCCEGGILLSLGQLVIK